MGRLIIDGNRVYEVDEDCLCRKNRGGIQKQKKENEILVKYQEPNISGMNRKLAGTNKNSI